MRKYFELRTFAWLEGILTGKKDSWLVWSVCTMGTRMGSLLPAEDGGRSQRAPTVFQQTKPKRSPKSRHGAAFRDEVARGYSWSS